MGSGPIVFGTDFAVSFSTPRLMLTFFILVLLFAGILVLLFSILFFLL